LLIQVRFARHTDRFDDVVAFYRDRLRLPQSGGFENHAGYDGVFLGLPGTNAHLEFTTGGGLQAPQPHPESLLVLYLGDWETVRAAANRLDDEPVEPANPYWADHGLTFADPDGFRVVLAAQSWNADDELTDRVAAVGLQRYRHLLKRLRR
jgi:catechol 2,3-dioxygenase-like lactoylglutathione lyase family enzyme